MDDAIEAMDRRTRVRERLLHLALYRGWRLYGADCHHLASPGVVLGDRGARVVEILLALLCQAAAVYPLAELLADTKLRLPAIYQHVLVSGDIRGAGGPRAYRSDGTGGARCECRDPFRRRRFLDLRVELHHARAAES